MAHENLKEDLRALIAEIIERDPSDVPDETPLRELGVDSMQAIEIITDIEKRYKIKIAESEYRNVSSLASVVAFLQTKLGA
ncbi:MAG: acyl carrier protein [Polyangiales bacterium]